MDEPTLSVVTIGRSEDEIDRLREHLREQTYDDYEFVYSTEPGIPQAWNDALSRARGSIVVFTETDARPVFDDWLETIAEEFDPDEDDVVYFGEYRGPSSFNFANTALRRSLVEGRPLDESFPVGEDSEFFARLDKRGVRFDENRVSPVYHEAKSTSRYLSRSFEYGMADARCIVRHGRLGPKVATDLSVSDGDSDVLTELLVFWERLSTVLESAAAKVLYWSGFLVALGRHAVDSVRD